MELSTAMRKIAPNGFVLSEVLFLLGLLFGIAFLGFFKFMPSQKEKLRRLNQEKEVYDGIKMGTT